MCGVDLSFQEVRKTYDHRKDLVKDLWREQEESKLLHLLSLREF